MKTWTTGNEPGWFDRIRNWIRNWFSGFGNWFNGWFDRGLNVTNNAFKPRPSANQPAESLGHIIWKWLRRFAIILFVIMVFEMNNEIQRLQYDVRRLESQIERIESFLSYRRPY